MPSENCWYKNEGSEVLERIFFLVARDEAAHMGFYRKLMKFEYADDPVGTMEDIAHVVYHFQIPGVGLIPEYDERLKVEGVAISHQHFLQYGIFPTLKYMGITRPELVKGLRKKQLQEATEAKQRAQEQGEAVA